jgi:ethanolamine utilization protein EutA
VSGSGQEGTEPSGQDELHFVNGEWRAYRYPEDAQQRLADRDLITGHRNQPRSLTLPPGYGGAPIMLTSVGVDIGSSTSHVMFSYLVLEPRGPVAPSSYVVVERTVTYQSPILFTPFTDPTTIDTAALARFIEDVYRDAGVTPDDIQTGATIVTGEAATKINAAAIAGLFAEQAGKFVCATAGPNLEAAMAAFGSGAVGRSVRRERGVDQVVLNVDIGGGTSKFAVCRNGRVIETAAINVGARLVAFDDEGRIARIDPAAKIVAETLGLNLILGQRLSAASQTKIADALADRIAQVAARGARDPLTERLMITSPLTYAGPLDAIRFSGGVAEYVYGGETRSYGDLGLPLGRAVKTRIERLGTPIETAEQRIRATVIGAALHTVQVTGNTVLITRPSLLPRRNVRIVAPDQPGDTFTVDQVRAAIAQALRRVDVSEGDDAVALSFRWRFEPSYDVLKTMALGIAAALPRTIARRLPVIIVYDVDIGGAMGSLLEKEVIPGADLISLDELHLGDLDYVDFGTEIEDTHVIPVVVKSLVFATARQLASGLVRDADPDEPPSGEQRSGDAPSRN